MPLIYSKPIVQPRHQSLAAGKDGASTTNLKAIESNPSE
jgi:hypothetical protein